jgi:hypothetical protein
LPKCIDCTGVKGSPQPIKRPSFGFNKGAKRQPKALWSRGTGLSGVHRTVSGAQPDPNSNSPPSGISRGTRAIIHRTVRCVKEARPQELASFGNLQRLVRYNSPDMSGVHRTVRCNSGATATSASTATCGALNARAARAEGRRAHTGAPDKEQCMSGVHRTSRRAHKSEAPTVRIQRQ